MKFETLGTAGLQGPGIEHLGEQAETLHVAGDHGVAVALRGGHDEAVHHGLGLARQFGLGSELRPGVEGCAVERQDATGEALLQLTPPGGELLAGPVARKRLRYRQLFRA